MYRVEVALHSLSIATQSHLTLPQLPLTSHGVVPKMVVSIPGPILECAFPALVQQFTGRVLPTTAQPEPVRFSLTVVEIWSDTSTLQILPLLAPSIQQVLPMGTDVHIFASSSGTQAHNKEPAVPERDLNRMVTDPDALRILVEPASKSDPDFIDLTLSDSVSEQDNLSRMVVDLDVLHTVVSDSDFIDLTLSDY